MWVYLRNNVYEYSYDFRNKTLAWIQADGWEIFYNSNIATINSYWFAVTNSAQNSTMAKVTLWNSYFNTAKKITLTFKSTVPNWNSNRFSMFSVATSSTRSWVTWPRYSYSWYQTSIYGTNYTDSISQTWEATVVTVVDLVAKTWATTSTTWYSRNWTLSDTEVSNIKNNTNWIYVSPWTISWISTAWWIANVYLKIEE